MALLTTTACAITPGPAAAPLRTPRPAVSPTPAPNVLAEAARNLKGLLAAEGPIACSGKDGRWQAVAYDESFRTRGPSFSTAPLAQHLAGIATKAGGEEANVRSLCGENGDPGMSPVSPDGRRLAVQIEPQSGGDTHVGWLDLVTGTFTDITEMSATKGYANKTYSDEAPGFAPDGSFWFERALEYYSADENGRLTLRRSSDVCGGGSDEDQVYRIVKNVAVPCPAAVHPSGRFVVRTGMFGLTFAPLAVEDAYYTRASVRGRACAAVAWVNATELLCKGNDNGFYTARVNPAAVQDDPEYVHDITLNLKAEIAPATENTIMAVALTRDRRSLIIAAEDDADTAKIYRASLVTPSDPVEVGPVPPEVRESFTLLGNFPMTSAG
ncbi:hypothetical protein JYK22_32495 [Nonomuraea sp. RK-328]|nr:hypothetical protein [Nonomuraea sp. RK-328]